MIPANEETGTGKPYAVLAVKHDGRRTLFQRYRTRKEAEDIVAALARWKCRAEIADLAADETPPEAA